MTTASTALTPDNATNMHGGSMPSTGPSASVIPFTRAARKSYAADKTVNGSLGAAAVNVPVFELSANAWVDYYDMQVTVTAAANAAAVAYEADAPWSVIQNIEIDDARGNPVLGPFNGYELFLVNRYGAYFDAPAIDSPRRDVNYSLVSGAAANGGSFYFSLRLPFATRNRDAFGALANGSTASQFKVNNLAIAPEGSVYSTSPTDAPTFQITFVPHWWTQPAATVTASNGSQYSAATAPNSGGKIWRWFKEQPAFANGQTSPVQLLTPRGHIIKSMVFIFRDNSGLRDNASIPAQTQILLNQQWQFQSDVQTWRRTNTEDLALTSQSFDVPGGPDTGVLAWTRLQTTSNQLVNNMNNADQYLVVGDNDKFELQATGGWPNGATVEVLYCAMSLADVALIGGALYS